MYTDPITKNTYPSKDWMMANMETLPEVKAAYGSQPKPVEPSVPTTLTTQPVASQPSTSGLTTEQSSGLQAIYNELQARQLAGTPANQPRVSSITDTKTIPEQALDTKSPALSTTTADTINSMIQKEQADLAARQASAQKTLSNAGVLGTGDTLQEQLLTGYQTNVPVSQYQTKLTEAQSQYGVTAALDEYKLQGEKVAQAKAVIENLDLQRQTELDAALNRQASMSSINAEQNRINQKYDSQRAKLVGDYNIEAAILATQSNNLTEANKLVSQAVDAYTSDITAEINRFNNLYSIASEFVSSLSKDEKSVLDDIKTQLYAKEETERERLTNVLNLKLQYSNAGIEPTDTLEEAIVKAEKIASSDAELNRQLKEAQLAEAQDGGIGMETLFSFYSQVEDIMSKDKTLSSTEAISKLPVSQSIKTQLLLMDSQMRASQQEELYTDINRVNTEPITKELVKELIGKYGFEELKQSAVDEETRNKLIQVNGELSAEARQQAAESFGSTVSGARDWWRENIYMGGIYEGLGGVFSPIVKGFREGIKK